MKAKFNKGNKVNVTFKNGEVWHGTVLFYDKKWNDYGVLFDNGMSLMVDSSRISKGD